MDLSQVETPIGTIDLARVRANAREVVAFLGQHGIAWRPHVKTHKSLEIAQIQLDAGAQGLTVATPHEAEVMSALCDDLLLGYPPVGASKVDRLIALPPNVRLTIGLDSEAALRPVSEAADGAGRVVGILIEFDAGLKRVGVTTPEELVALTQLVHELPGVEPRGVMFYPGHIRVARSAQQELLATLDARLNDYLVALEQAGHPAQVVSGGSTPTLWSSHHLRGLTEVRAGTCIFNDRDIQTLEGCTAAGLAYSVLTTVVSIAVPGQVVVDAGSKALAKEPFRSDGDGFGALLDRPEVTVRALSEEHGVLDLSGTDWRPEVGDRVRIVPNHVCVSVNLQDSLLVIDGEQTRSLALDGRGRAPYPVAPIRPDPPDPLHNNKDTMSNLQRVQSDDAPAAIGPYSQAIIAGGFVFCSGQIPFDPKTGELVPGDAAAQTERVMLNLSAVLAEAGTSLSSVVKTTVFLSDMGLFASMNEVYARHFGDHQPARATVAVKTLPKNVDVEIDCIACVE